MSAHLALAGSNQEKVPFMHPTLGNLSTPKAIGDTRLAKRSDTIAGKPLFMCLLSFRTNARIMTLTLDSPFGIADGGSQIADRPDSVQIYFCMLVWRLISSWYFLVRGAGIPQSFAQRQLHVCDHFQFPAFSEGSPLARGGKRESPAGRHVQGVGQPLRQLISACYSHVNTVVQLLNNSSPRHKLQIELALRVQLRPLSHSDNPASFLDLVYLLIRIGHRHCDTLRKNPIASARTASDRNLALCTRYKSIFKILCMAVYFAYFAYKLSISCIHII